MTSKSFFNIPLVYEDDFVAAINKPSGIAVHGNGRTNEKTLSDWVLEHCPEIESVGEPFVLADAREVSRPGIVHRLDKETSGILVMAKTKETFLCLKEQFQKRLVEKIYNAFIYGVPSKRTGVIRLSVSRGKKDFRRFTAIGERAGGRWRKARNAETEYTIIRTNGKFSFAEARPKTGRTHQLRVHFKALGHPVVCDRLYAPKRPCALGFNRMALHARRISFLLPNETRLILEAPLPEDFRNALKEL